MKQEIKEKILEVLIEENKEMNVIDIRNKLWGRGIERTYDTLMRYLKTMADERLIGRKGKQRKDSKGNYLRGNWGYWYHHYPNFYNSESETKQLRLIN